ncbi:PASTA domain-containing protein [Micromonospora sp. NPDC050200]|uniref:PASTA domain-containing protein n=1 Tax=Micromonospora sp. NPDC050200 TaxID=3155664 RepID=UPI0033DB2361
MSDGHTLLDTPAPGRPNRAPLLIGGGLAFVLLATVGATAGWVLAGLGETSPTDPPAATAATAPAPTGDPTSAAAPPPVEQPATVAPTTPRTTTPPAPSADSTSYVTVPDLVGDGFEGARSDLRDRKLGWRLIFGTGLGEKVERLDPAPGTPVSHGTTVKVYVAGPAPEAEVPDLDDYDCADAAATIVERGFYPRYRTGRVGKVHSQDPEPDTTRHWNDEVAISCGAEEA